MTHMKKAKDYTEELMEIWSDLNFNLADGLDDIATIAAIHDIPECFKGDIIRSASKLAHANFLVQGMRQALENLQLEVKKNRQ